MVIIIDMTSGKQIFVQDSKQEGVPPQPIGADSVFPESQPYPVPADERNIMPALMEHTFSKTP